MAASTPTGPDSPLVRTLGILSVVIALIGVVTAFAKAADDDNSSGTPAAGSGTPTVSPTRSATTSASPTPSPTPRTSPSATSVATGSAHPTGSTAPATSASPTHGGGHSSPAGSPTASAPVASHHVTLHFPALGNYSYATSGGESTSFPGTSRKFPKTTTISITKSGCGVKETWKPLSSHVETEQLCLIHNQVHLMSTQTMLSFFGQTVTQSFTCASNAYIYAPTVRPGDTWSFDCSSQDSKVTQTLKALRYVTINVGGTNVRTLKITVSSAVSGGDNGDSKQTIWIAATNRPQMIRNVASINAKQGSFSYQENQRLQLKSLTPA